jgi:hypothetical protein
MLFCIYISLLSVPIQRSEETCLKHVGKSRQLQLNPGTLFVTMHFHLNLRALFENYVRGHFSMMVLVLRSSLIYDAFQGPAIEMFCETQRNRAGESKGKEGAMPWASRQIKFGHKATGIKIKMGMTLHPGSTCELMTSMK